MHTCVATTAFGLEATLKREIANLELEVIKTMNGRVYFKANNQGMAKANLWLRTAEHVYIVLNSGQTLTFDALFELVSHVKFAQYLQKNGQFIVNANSVKSTLYSLRDIQKISKKALIQSMENAYPHETFKEQGPRHDILITILDEHAEVWLDTSGDALHKRGYRLDQGEAPIKETLAASMIELSFYNRARILVDPFCGSGTIPIEAAMIAKNIAPGLNRDFAYEQFVFIDQKLSKTVRKEALQSIDHETAIYIYASDIQHDMIEIAKENAMEAGVYEDIRFQVSDFRLLDFSLEHGVVISNPPYGNRLGKNQKEVDMLYKDLGDVIRKYTKNSYYLLTPYVGFERTVKKRADKTRVLFNGRIKTRFYQYFGEKPTK